MAVKVTIPVESDIGMPVCRDYPEYPVLAPVFRKADAWCEMDIMGIQCDHYGHTHEIRSKHGWVVVQCYQDVEWEDWE